MQVQFQSINPFRLSLFSVTTTLLGNIKPDATISIPENLGQLSLQIIGVASAFIALAVSGYKALSKARREEKIEDQTAFEKANKESLVAQNTLLKIQLEEEQGRYKVLKEMSDEYKQFIKVKIEKLESDSSTLAKILRIIHRQVQTTDSKVDSKLAPLIEIVKQHHGMIGEDSKENVPIVQEITDERKRNKV